MSILITGGAGFIGSHTAKLFAETGLDVVVFDNLSTGRREHARWGIFVEGNLTDVAMLRQVMRERKVTAVMHLAASAHVGESMARPELYFANNVTASVALLDAMRAEGVARLLFASSCSVYGESASEVLREDETAIPLSAYGESKLAVERMLPWFAQAHGLQWVALRYFNTAGAVGDLGEDITLSRRIIPRALRAALSGAETLKVYGTEFATQDGSAVRDYVHVADVARANLLGLRYLEAGGSGATVNIGGGSGTSVLEIIAAVERATGKTVPYAIQPAKPGDPGRAIADAFQAQKTLGWTAIGSDVERIVESLVNSACPAGQLEPQGLFQT